MDTVKGFNKISKCNYDVYTKEKMDKLLNNKQGTLTFDETPTENSANPVTSGGIHTTLGNIYTKTESDTKFFENGKIAVLTGTLTNDGTKVITGTVNYPEGFNQSNCVVISSMFTINGSTKYQYGSAMDTTSLINGLQSHVKLMDDNINIRGRKISINDDGTAVATVINSDHQYKIVLMKIS